MMSWKGIQYALAGLLALLSFWFMLLFPTALEFNEWYLGTVPHVILSGCIGLAALLSFKQGRVGGWLIILLGIFFGINLAFSNWYFPMQPKEFKAGDLIVGLCVSLIGAAIVWSDNRAAPSQSRFHDL